MIDDLAIPAALDLKDPEVRARHDEARRNWKPGSTRMTGEKRAKPKTDSKGRMLPASMDDGSWALLRSQEKDDSAKTAARLAALKELGETKRRERQELKAAIGTEPRSKRATKN